MWLAHLAAGQLAVAILVGAGCTARNWHNALTPTLQPRQIEGLAVDRESQPPRTKGIVISYIVTGAADEDWPKHYLLFPTDAQARPLDPFSATRPAQRYMEIVPVGEKQRQE